MLAFKELLGSKLKFGLIALAIGLVVSLTLSMSAMSEGLLSGMTGAKGSLAADALVFQKDTYPTFERSILSAEDMKAIAAVPGVESVYGVGHSFATVDSPEGSFDVRIFGLGDRFDQLPIVEGSGSPGPGETVADISTKLKGVELGDVLTLAPVDYKLKVIGFTDGRRYVMAPTLTVDLPTWKDIYVGSVLGTAEGGEAGSPMSSSGISEQLAGGATVAAVGFDQGVTLEEMQKRFEGKFDIATPAQSARSGNGMNEMVLAVDGIQWVSIVIGAILVGVFFYITTLHKTSQIAAIKAIGASNFYLYRQLVAQITILVSIAIVFGMLIALGLGSAMPPAMAFEPEPRGWILTILAVYATSYLGSLFSLRSILKIDPATALGRSEQ